MNELVLSDADYEALRERVMAALVQVPESAWQWSAPVIDVPVIEAPAGSNASKRLTGMDGLALVLTGVMVMIFGGAGLALLGSGKGWWSLFGFLDVAILIGYAVWLYRDKIKWYGGAA